LSSVPNVEHYMAMARHIPISIFYKKLYEFNGRVFKSSRHMFLKETEGRTPKTIHCPTKASGCSSENS